MTIGRLAYEMYVNMRDLHGVTRLPQLVWFKRAALYRPAKNAKGHKKPAMGQKINVA